MSETAIPRVTVMGLGLFGGGAAAARYFSERGADVTVTDLRDAETLAPSVEALAAFPEIRWVLGEHREKDFSDADIVVANQAVRPDNHFVRLARDAGTAVRTETGLALEHARGRVLGVTGSNGKSTTTVLLGRMVRAMRPDTLVGGNMGAPLLNELAGRDDAPPVVIELSSFQLAWLDLEKRSPDIAVVTGISPNHLDWHEGMDEYAQAKQAVIRHQTADDTAVLNAGDGVVSLWGETAPGQVVRFDLDDPGDPDAAFVRDGEVVIRRGGEETPFLSVESLRLPGEHNRLNLVAAAAAAHAFGVAPEKAGPTVEDFTGLPHRLESVAVVGGVEYVNDSDATTPEATAAGLRAYADRDLTLIAGGVNKGFEFELLADEIAARAEAVVLIGRSALMLADAVERAAVRRDDDRPGPVIEQARSMEEAVRRAAELTPEGGVALLSPACSSFDMFDHFEARGDAFRAAVRALA